MNALHVLRRFSMNQAGVINQASVIGADLPRNSVCSVRQKVLMFVDGASLRGYTGPEGVRAFSRRGVPSMKANSGFFQVAGDEIIQDRSPRRFAVAAPVFQREWHLLRIAPSAIMRRDRVTSPISTLSKRCGADWGWNRTQNNAISGQTVDSRWTVLCERHHVDPGVGFRETALSSRSDEESRSERNSTWVTTKITNRGSPAIMQLRSALNGGAPHVLYRSASRVLFSGAVATNTVHNWVAARCAIVVPPRDMAVGTHENEAASVEARDLGIVD